MERRRASALIGALAIVVAACSGSSASPSASATAAAPSAPASVAPSVEPSVAPSVATAEKCTGQKVSLELSFIPNVQHAGFLVAAARGYYKDEGLELEVKPGSPAVDTTQDLADGTVDLAQVDYVDIVEARAAGVPIKAIAQTYKLPFFFWYANKSSGIASVADWKGKKLGAIQPGDYPERDAMMLAAGLDPKKDVTILQQDFGTDDFIAGKIDIGEGVVFYHPAYLIGVNQKKWPDDFNVFNPADLGADFASQTVAANEDFIAKDPAAIRCFLRASIRGWQATFADAQKAVDDVMTFIPEGAIPKPHQQGAINSVLPIVGSGATDATLLKPTPDKYTATIAQLKTLGYLKTDVDVAATYDGSFYDSMGPVAAPATGGVDVADPDPSSPRRPRIAVFAGPNATVLNSQPLVTSDKARRARGLPPRTDRAGRPIRFDVLRPQRLAAPVVVFVEAFSAHPLEIDAAPLYGPPDGYLDASGAFHAESPGEGAVPVHRIELRPEDGLYPLPYMAVQADGQPWDGDEARPFGPADHARQPFYPDASRVFEEIDRLQPGDDGLAGHLDRLADYDFLRPAPPGGWTRDGEERGHTFFPYRPPHLIRQPSRLTLARLTNEVQAALAGGVHDGALWLEGSPYVEETAWWLNLLVDTALPIAATAAQRPHGALGNDGDRNIVDAVAYLVSRAWADEAGRDALGAVAVIDQRVVASRAIQKADARPGGYEATGGHGGVLGTVLHDNRVVVSSIPTQRHTWRSDVRLTVLPRIVDGVRAGQAGAIETMPIAVRDDGGLVPAAMPIVTLVKHGQYIEEDDVVDVGQEVGIIARIERSLARHPLAGFVAEGAAPFGSLNESAELALRRATFSGLPVVKVGRGNASGMTEDRYAPVAIAGGNLSATKARLLLMACLLRFGALPPARDPDRPTADEVTATQAALDRYRAVFASH